jgi:O-antigen/teichoic acid export membrane protein
MQTTEPSPDCAGTAEGSPLRRMAQGTVWMVAARWGVRGIGLVSTVILARLLAPADFGLVAMGTVTMGFVQVFAEGGQNLAVIRHADPTPEHYDTAWTMSVGAGLIVALVMVAAAPLASWYFHEPRAARVVAVLALAPLINGFTSAGVDIGFRRDLMFGKEFRFLVLRKLFPFAVTVPLAVVWRDYWALVAGIVCGELLSVAASYRMHRYRPRFRFDRLREIWSFSGWMQLTSIAGFFGDQVDQIVVGNLAGTALMGSYNIAADLATAPTKEIVVPAARAVFPVYATLLHEPARLAQSYLGMLSVIAVIALSTGTGVALVAHDMVALVLGAKWSAVAALIPWLAVGGGVWGVANSVNSVLSVTGNTRLAATRNAAFLLLVVPGSVVAGIGWGAQGVAAARALAALLFTPVMFYSVMRVIPVTAGEIGARLWRPAGAAVAMAAVVQLSGTAELASLPLRLLCNVGLGAVAFAAALVALWLAAGRPEGAERLAVEHARARMRRRRAAKGMGGIQAAPGPRDG